MVGCTSIRAARWSSPPRPILQLGKQTIPAIERHRLKFQNWTSVKARRYELTTPTGGSIVGFVTNDAQNVEGWHKKDDVDGPLLYIVNEAKGFKEDKFERIDRCGFNALMYISSPGAKMGRFYDSHAGPLGQLLYHHGRVCGLSAHPAGKARRPDRHVWH